MHMDVSQIYIFEKLYYFLFTSQLCSSLCWSFTLKVKLCHYDTNRGQIWNIISICAHI